MLNGQSLKARRLEQKLSQAALGKAIGLDGQYIYHLEHGIQPDIRASTLGKLADALHCTTDELLGRKRRAAA